MFYTGKTGDFEQRLAAHNRGENVSTAKHRPWRPVVGVWFAEAARADAFERYLKSGSGGAFSRRHFR
jgi:predicted GIY-YIG superfamily endonuclease